MDDLFTECDENVDLIENPGSYKPSYVLVGIDTHSSMFESDGGPSPFRNCILAAYRICDALLLKATKGSYSPFSIMLHDKEEKANLVDFQDNMIKTYKMLKEMTLLSEDNLKTKYMRDYDLEVTSFFQSCKKKFKNISTNFYKRILIFITNDPDPVKGDSNKRFTALKEAENFKENDIVFQVIVPNVDFDFGIFYSELFVLLPQKHVEIICEDEEGIYEKLSSTIWFRHFHRKMCFYPFADDFTKYMFVYTKSCSKNIRLLNNDYMAEDGTSVKRIAVNPANDEVSQMNEKFILQNADTKKIFHGLTFDLGEKLELVKNEFPIGYTLLYVSDRLIPMSEVIAEPKIVEVDAKEELPYFNEFWQYCVNNEKVMVCAKKLTAADNPRAVEFIPKLINNNKVFLVKEIPFSDEMEEPEKGNVIEEVSPTQKQIEITDELIDRLSLDFSSSFLTDITAMKKEWYVKSKFLDEPRVEKQLNEFKECFTPEDVENKIGDIVHEYMSSFPQPKGTKRKK